MIRVRRLVWKEKVLGFRFEDAFDVNPSVAWKEGYPVRDAGADLMLHQTESGGFVTRDEQETGEKKPEYSAEPELRQAVYAALDDSGRRPAAEWPSEPGDVLLTLKAWYVEQGSVWTAEEYGLVDVSGPAASLATGSLLTTVPGVTAALVQGDESGRFTGTTLVTRAQWARLVAKQGGRVRPAPEGVALSWSDRGGLFSSAARWTPGGLIESVWTGRKTSDPAVEAWYAGASRFLLQQSGSGA